MLDNNLQKFCEKYENRQQNMPLKLLTELNEGSWMDPRRKKRLLRYAKGLVSLEEYILFR